MHYLSIRTKKSIQNFSWLLKHKETYLIIVLLLQNVTFTHKDNIFLKQQSITPILTPTEEVETISP